MKKRKAAIPEEKIAMILASTGEPLPRSRLVEAIQEALKVSGKSAGFIAERLEDEGYIARSTYAYGDNPMVASGSIEMFRLTDKAIGLRRKYL